MSGRTSAILPQNALHAGSSSPTAAQDSTSQLAQTHSAEASSKVSSSGNNPTLRGAPARQQANPVDLESVVVRISPPPADNFDDEFPPPPPLPQDSDVSAIDEFPLPPPPPLGMGTERFAIIRQQLAEKFSTTQSSPLAQAKASAASAASSDDDWSASDDEEGAQPVRQSSPVQAGKLQAGIREIQARKEELIAQFEKMAVLPKLIIDSHASQGRTVESLSAQIVQLKQAQQEAPTNEKGYKAKADSLKFELSKANGMSESSSSERKAKAAHIASLELRLTAAYQLYNATNMGKREAQIARLGAQLKPIQEAVTTKQTLEAQLQRDLAVCDEMLVKLSK